MHKTLVLVVSLVCVAVASDSGAEDAFGKVLLREEIDTGSAPSFLDEALQLEGFRHLSVEDRLGHERAFPFLVQLQTAALKEHSLESLQRQLGDVDLSHYVPHNTFLLHTSHAHAAQIAANAALVRWVGNLHPAHKLAPSVAQYHPDHVPVNELVVQVAPQQSEAELQAVLSDIISRAKENGLDVIQKSQIETNSRIKLVLRDSVHVELAEFLSHQPEVEYISRAFIAHTTNAFAQTIIWEGNETMPEDGLLRTKRNGLDGKGQVIGILDSGIARHSCFFKQNSFVGSTTYKKWVWHAAPEDISCESDFSEFNRKIVQYVGFADFQDSNHLQDGHGTHVSGSILGSLSSEYETSELGLFEGIAPAARAALFDAAGETGDSLAFPGDFQRDVLNWAYFATARVHSNSWGSRSSPGGVGSRYSPYSTVSRDFDEFMWKHKDFLIVAASGNDGGCSSKSSVYSPGNAKNVLTVGASMNSPESWRYVHDHVFRNDRSFKNFWDSNPEDFNSESLAGFSSIGPTEDGRIKPDVIAPGHYITSAFNSRKNGQCNSSVFGETVRLLRGTSMAAPQVSGSALLIRQYFLEGFYPSGERNSENAFTPSASLIKAIMINSAVDMKGVKHSYPTIDEDCPISRKPLSPRPSIFQGFGRMSLDSVLYFSNEPSRRRTFIPSLNSSASDVFFDSTLSTDEVHSFKFCTIPESREEIRITLVWTDPPSSFLASRKLVNNLDLFVRIGSLGLYGNSGTYRTEVDSTKFRFGRDVVNPVECVYFSPSASNATDIVIDVIAYNVPIGPQPYSLVISGDITQGDCESDGVFEPIPTITKNSVIEVPIPRNSECKNVHPIDDSEDSGQSSSISPTPVPTLYPTLAPSPSPTPAPIMSPTPPPESLPPSTGTDPSADTMEPQTTLESPSPTSSIDPNPTESSGPNSASKQQNVIIISSIVAAVLLLTLSAFLISRKSRTAQKPLLQSRTSVEL